MTGRVKVMRSGGGFGESDTGSTQPSLAAVCDLHAALLSNMERRAAVSKWASFSLRLS